MNYGQISVLWLKNKYGVFQTLKYNALIIFLSTQDLEEHGIAPRKFATVGTFTSEERKRKCIEDATSVHSKATLGIHSALIDITVPKM